MGRQPSSPHRSEAVGTLITRHRQRLALTEVELAQQIGVPRETLARWESGGQLPYTRWIRNGDGPGPLAAALGIPWQQLAKARQRALDARRHARLIGLEVVTVLLIVAVFLDALLTLDALEPLARTFGLS